MSTYAHIVAGQVAEALFTPPEGVAISECFHPSLLWVDVSTVTPQPQPGWSASEHNGVWSFAAPPAPQPVVPQIVSRYQAMAALFETPSPAHAGQTLLDDVQAAVTAAGGLALLAWQNANIFERHGVFITQLAPQLGLSDAQVDALFVAAANVVG